tara:strand:- start:539 stop:3580 length:3042 start_codon:yes stop_codon:yes gene_type:complete
MANQNTEKALLGYAITSSSLLQKIEAIEGQARDSIFRIESILVTSLSVTQGLAASISENTKTLKDIKEILLERSGAENAKFKGGGDLTKKLLGLGGLIALAGFGVFTLSLAFQQAGKVTLPMIANGIAVIAALYPISILMGGIVNNPESGGLFANLKIMKTFTLTMGMSMLMMYVMSHALAGMAPVGPDKLVTALAIGAVIYLMGQTFVSLIKAWEFSGIMNFMLNKNNTDDIMKSMLLMTVQTVIMAIAMNLMPNVKQQTAINFVIMAAAMIPLSVALVAMRFALPAIQKINVGTIGKMGLAVAMLGLAFIPIAWAAKKIAGMGVTPEQIQQLTMMAMALAPLVAVIGMITAIINFAKEGKASKSNGLGPTTLLKQDNSRKRNQKMDIKGIFIFALKAVVILGVLSLMGYALSKAGPGFIAGTQAMSKINYTEMIKMVGFIGITLLIGGFIIGKVVSMIKGKTTSDPGVLGSLVKGKKSKAGKLSVKDMIMAAIIMPIIAIGIVATAFILKEMPTDLPKLGMEFLKFAAISGLAMIIFGFALGKTLRTLGRIRRKTLVTALVIIPIVAFGILATAWLFAALPANMDAIGAPSLEWSVKAGLAILAFGLTVALLTKISGKVKVKEAVKVLLVIALAALSVLMVAYAFSLLSGIEYGEPPPLAWSIGVGIALFIVGGVILALGAIAIAVTPVGILLGALTVLVGAAVLYAVAWIFTQIGKIDGLESSAQKITNVLFMPFNAMVTLFKRFKDEIGIENMGGLALGLVQLGGGFIVLAAALAGSGAANMFGSMAGALGSIADGFTKLIGGSVEMKPSELLKFMVLNGKKLEGVVGYVGKLGEYYGQMASAGAPFILALKPLTDIVYNFNEYGSTSAANFLKFSNAHVKFKNSNNDLSLTKLNATTKMFDSLTALAKADSQGNVMKTLADNLLKSVAELSSAVKDLDDVVSKQNKSNGNMGDAITNAIGKMKDIIGIKTKEVEASGQPLASLDDVVDAISELEETLIGSGIRVRGRG